MPLQHRRWPALSAGARVREMLPLPAQRPTCARPFVGPATGRFSDTASNLPVLSWIRPDENTARQQRPGYRQERKPPWHHPLRVLPRSPTRHPTRVTLLRRKTRHRRPSPNPSIPRIPNLPSNCRRIPTAGRPRKEHDMPRGDKSAYTDKQKRQAQHIEESYESRGVDHEEAERRAWSTVNKESGGGKKSGSGRGHPIDHGASRKGGTLGGKASAARPAQKRSASAKKAAATRKRNAANE